MEKCFACPIATAARRRVDRGNKGSSDATQRARFTHVSSCSFHRVVNSSKDRKRCDVCYVADQP